MSTVASSAGLFPTSLFSFLSGDEPPTPYRDIRPGAPLPRRQRRPRLRVEIKRAEMKQMEEDQERWDGLA